MAITDTDIQNLVVKYGIPETIFVSIEDFKKIYAVYRSINRDEKGAYILVMNTKIRSKTAQDIPEVDLSDKTIWT